MNAHFYMYDFLIKQQIKHMEMNVPQNMEQSRLCNLRLILSMYFPNVNQTFLITYIADSFKKTFRIREMNDDRLPYTYLVIVGAIVR